MVVINQLANFSELILNFWSSGGELFAKRRKKADKWVVDESSIGSTVPSQFADHFVQQQFQQQQQFQLQQQQEHQVDGRCLNCIVVFLWMGQTRSLFVYFRLFKQALQFYNE